MQKTRHLDQNAVAVVHFVLDNLGSPAVVKSGAGLHFFILELYPNGAVAGAFAGAAQQGQAAFFRLKRAGAVDDLGIEHNRVSRGRGAFVPEGDDALANADHVGGHANTTVLVG